MTIEATHSMLCPLDSSLEETSHESPHEMPQSMGIQTKMKNKEEVQKDILKSRGIFSGGVTMLVPFPFHFVHYY